MFLPPLVLPVVPLSSRPQPDVFLPFHNLDRLRASVLSLPQPSPSLPPHLSHDARAESTVPRLRRRVGVVRRHLHDGGGSSRRRRDADADATRLLDSSHRTARERTNRGATTCARIPRRIARAVAVAVAVDARVRRRAFLSHMAKMYVKGGSESHTGTSKSPNLKISSRSIGRRGSRRDSTIRVRSIDARALITDAPLDRSIDAMLSLALSSSSSRFLARDRLGRPDPTNRRPRSAAVVVSAKKKHSTKKRDAREKREATPTIRSSLRASFDPTRPMVVDAGDHAAKIRKAVRKAILNVEYEEQLSRLQSELVVWQDYVVANGKKVVILFEGRDAAGKGGCISRITDVLSARVCKVVALGAPTEAEKSQWYFQKYVQHLPSAGHIVLFDRSWYNRSGVERVMGFATPEQVEQFEREVNVFEQMLVDADTHVVKLWFDVSDEQQEMRFRGRLEREEKRWKLSPMDLFARSKWYDYSHARDLMFQNTSKTVPWSIVPADDKRVARLNAIQHILSTMDYEEVKKEDLKLPARQDKPHDYQEVDLHKIDPSMARVVPQVYTTQGLESRDEDDRSWQDIADVVTKKSKKHLKLSSDDKTAR